MLTLRLVLYPILFAAAAGAVMADGRATIQSPTPQGTQALEVSWSGDGLVRFDPQQQAGTYMLVREGTLYGVTNTGGMGTMVMNLSTLGEMAEGMAGAGADAGAGSQPPGMSIERAVDVVSIEPTGRSETVAGFDGELYNITWVAEDGEEHTDNAVLSDAPLAIELDQAFATMAATTQSGEADARQLAIRERGLATLRYGDSFTVTELSGEGRPDGDYVLPAEPTDLMDMMQGMGTNN